MNRPSLSKIYVRDFEELASASVNSNATGTITPMFSSYDWMKPNLKQKAGTARGKCSENGLFERTGESYEE